jgi:DNA-binding NtrC family response regulator
MTDPHGTLHTLLLVDDDAETLAALARALRGTGHRILTTTAPAQALELLDTEAVDVIVSDVDMPGMSGLELMRRVRRSFPAVVRILLTGQGCMETVISGINDGEIFRYLTKPWDREVLRSTIAQAIARLEELRRTNVADARAARRRALLAALEQEHPGISDVAHGPDGTHWLDEVLLEALPGLPGYEWLAPLLAPPAAAS